MGDPERGVCSYCNQEHPLLTPNKEQKNFMKENEEQDSGKNPKYCAGCLRRCDKKIARRKRREARLDSRQQSSSTESQTISYANEFSLEPSLSTDQNHNESESRSDHSDLSLYLNNNKQSRQSNGSNKSHLSHLSRGSNDSQSSQTSSRKRLAESDDSSGSSLSLYLPDHQSAKKSKSDEQSPGNSRKSNGSKISPLTFDDDQKPEVIIDLVDDHTLAPFSSNALQPNGTGQDKNNKTSGRTGAPGGGPPDGDDDSSNSESDDLVSAPRIPISSQSSRRSNASHSSDSRSKRLSGDNISGSAPSQKHVQIRKPPPAKPYSRQEQEQMKNKNHRSRTIGSYRRSNGA